MSVGQLRDHGRYDPAEGVAPGAVTCLFDHELEPALIDFVNDSSHLVGCVAWVTNRQVLAAMAQRPTALVVQAERQMADGLRQLTCGFAKTDFHEAVRRSRRRWPHGIPAVSVVGAASRRGRTALMHHKFLVDCDLGDDGLLPRRVWTGSMNFSHGGATRSLENAVIVDDPFIAGAYLAAFETALTTARDWS